LEHIEDDLAGLCNIYGALSPGGRAIVLVPCGQEIYGQLDVILGHYRRYSISQLRNRFEQAGFAVEQIVEFNRISRPGVVHHRQTVAAFANQPLSTPDV